MNIRGRLKRFRFIGKNIEISYGPKNGMTFAALISGIQRPAIVSALFDASDNEVIRVSVTTDNLNMVRRVLIDGERADLPQ